MRQVSWFNLSVRSLRPTQEDQLIKSFADCTSPLLRQSDLRLHSSRHHQYTGTAWILYLFQPYYGHNGFREIWLYEPNHRCYKWHLLCWWRLWRCILCLDEWGIWSEENSEHNNHYYVDWWCLTDRVCPCWNVPCSTFCIWVRSWYIHSLSFKLHSGVVDHLRHVNHYRTCLPIRNCAPREQRNAGLIERRSHRGRL